LVDHVQAVGVASKVNAKAFAENIAEVAGWLHDLGKMKPRFQARLSDSSIIEPHAAEGARYAFEQLPYGALLAQVVLGHHQGLDDGNRPGQNFQQRLEEADQLSPPGEWLIPKITSQPQAIAALAGADAAQCAYALCFLGRMVFSALVDADRSATAAFYERRSGRADEPGSLPSLEALRERLDRYMTGHRGDGKLNALRRRVHAHVRGKSGDLPGIFSLTVPTGGGKTLASLGFALDHAIRHGMERLIFVIPYTSIVEQTAEVFRQVFGELGDLAVLEHHSAFDWEAPRKDDELAGLKAAAELWDRPVIVTTAVQFLESLHARRGSPCRKLHRMTNAVVVLDEAQTLPRHLLRPSLAALKELARGYRSSIVFCTATQPALLKGEPDGFPAPEGLEREGPLALRELAPDPAALHDALRRVQVTQIGQLDNVGLANALAQGEGGLAILNNRKQARAVFDLLRERGLPETFHLSTNMTARHRREVLDVVRHRLKADRPVRLVSTSLIEAGVDISFPVVYRALAGLDSIVQAAGRCNREGRLQEPGRVVVFEAERGTEGEYAPPAGLRQMADVTRTILAAHPDDPLSPDAVRAYFRQVFWNTSHGMDAGILDNIAAAWKASPKRPVFPYESIARAYQIIEDGARPVVILGGDGGLPESKLEELRFVTGAGSVARSLQSYQVQVPTRIRQKMWDAGVLRAFREADFDEQFLLLDQPGLYDANTGLRWDDFGDLGFLSF
jgi:CRISPR-associated endonuclease/helicase Cas3